MKSWGGSPAWWAGICCLVRLIALLALPVRSNFFMDRVSVVVVTEGKPDSAIAFLQRRTDYQPLTVDEHCYDEIAQNVVIGRGFVLDSIFVVTSPGQPTMYAGCGYPLFVAIHYWLFGIGNQLPVFLSQILLQSLAALVLVRLATRIAGGWGGGITGAFFSFHPVLIWLSLSVMTEAVLVPATALLLWLWLDRFSSCRIFTGTKRVVLIGGTIGFMCLTRSTCAGFLPLAGLLLWLENRHKTGWWRRLNGLALMLLVFGVICAPWTIRNFIHWKKLIPFSTKSGVNAWFFNHPGLKVEFSPAAFDGPNPVDLFSSEIQSLPDEAARDAKCMALFKQFVREQPFKFLGLCGIRFCYALLPMRVTSTSFNASVSAWYAKGLPILVMLLCVLTCFKAKIRWRRLGWRVFPAILLLIYWQALQTLAGPGLRYRTPVEPAWALLCGVAASACLSAWVKSRALPPVARRWLAR